MKINKRALQSRIRGVVVALSDIDYAAERDKPDDEIIGDLKIQIQTLNWLVEELTELELDAAGEKS